MFCDVVRTSPASPCATGDFKADVAKRRKGLDDSAVSTYCWWSDKSSIFGCVKVIAESKRRVQLPAWVVFSI